MIALHAFSQVLSANSRCFDGCGGATELERLLPDQGPHEPCVILTLCLMRKILQLDVQN